MRHTILFLITCFCLLILSESVNGQTRKKKFRKHKMEMKIELLKYHFIASEDIELKLSIQNTGNLSVEIPDPFKSTNWQPSYQITGPSYPDGYTFTFRTAVKDDKRLEPDNVNPILVTLGPGKTIESSLPLHRWLQIKKPGEYKINSRLRWKNISIESNQLVFKIEEAMVKSAGVGVDFGITDLNDMWVGWLQQGTEKVSLYKSYYLKDKLAGNVFKNFTTQQVFDVTKDAEDVLIPWTNYERKEALSFWIAWRGDNKLFAYTPLLENPLFIEQQEKIEMLVRPAIMTKNGNLDVFAITNAGSVLQYFYFPAQTGDGVPNQGKINWKLNIPFEAKNGRCAVMPKEFQKEQRIALVGQRNDNLLICHLKFYIESDQKTVEVVQIPNAQVIQGSQPGICIDSSGVSHVAILFETTDKEPYLAMAEMTFGADGVIKDQPKITKFRKNISTPIAATVSYSVDNEKVMNRSWVVLFQADEYMSSSSQTITKKLLAPAVIPLDLIQIGNDMLILISDSVNGPQFLGIK
jgi:hypothetical protein